MDSGRGKEEEREERIGEGRKEEIEQVERG